MSDGDFILDTSGLNCPFPIMKVKTMLSDMQAGKTLKVITTDPGSAKDFTLFCQNRGYELVSSNQEDDKLIYYIKKVF